MRRQLRDLVPAPAVEADRAAGRASPGRRAPGRGPGPSGWSSTPRPGGRHSPSTQGENRSGLAAIGNSDATFALRASTSAFDRDEDASTRSWSSNHGCDSQRSVQLRIHATLTTPAGSFRMSSASMSETTTSIVGSGSYQRSCQRSRYETRQPSRASASPSSCAVYQSPQPAAGSSRVSVIPACSGADHCAAGVDPVEHDLAEQPRPPGVVEVAPVAAVPLEPGLEVLRPLGRRLPVPERGLRLVDDARPGLAQPDAQVDVLGPVVVAVREPAHGLEQGAPDEQAGGRRRGHLDRGRGEQPSGSSPAPTLRGRTRPAVGHEGHAPVLQREVRGSRGGAVAAAGAARVDQPRPDRADRRVVEQPSDEVAQDVRAGGLDVVVEDPQQLARRDGRAPGCCRPRRSR